jgi:predicted N-formylglutamate amidohydrolase
MLLTRSDAAPVEIERGDRAGTLLFTCEHAGRAVPERLAGLGLAEADLADHIGWDPGALPLARALAARFEAPLVAQPYSRLVIDCNRPRHATDLAPAEADARPVPGNAALAAADLDSRWNEIHRPFHAAVAERAARATALVSVHSFAPRRRADTADRPVHVGVLARRDSPLRARLLAALGAAVAGPVALNAPYEIEDESDYTIPVHAEPAGLPHVLLEVRNDLIAEAAGVARLARAIGDALAPEAA